MGTSSAMSTSNSRIVYSIECIQNTQNVANNTSNVTVKVRAWRTNTGYETYGTGTVYCKINGTQYSAGITSSQKITNSGIELFNRTVDVGHNADGTKALAMSAWISHSQFSSSEQGYTQNLTTIPRASSFTLSQGTVTFGSTQQVITINRASSAFTHKITYKAASNHSWVATENATTSFSFTPSINDSQYYPNSTSGTATITVETYNGGTFIGSASRNFTVLVPSSVVPSFSSLSVARVDNGVPSAWGEYVQSKSKATLTINGASGAQGSSINKYEISGGGYSSTSASFTTGPINSSGTVTFTGTITDSRGRSASKTVNITVQPYAPPNISNSAAYRCTSGGVANDEGTYIKAELTYSFSSVSGKNTATGKADYRPNGGSWTGAATIASGSSAIIGGGSVSPDNSYQARVYVTDAFGTVEKIIDIGTAAVTLDLRNGGKGLAIGMVSQKDALEVAMGTWFYNGFTVDKGTVFNDGATMNKSITFANDIGLNWRQNGDGANILFHGDTVSDASYLRLQVTDDLDESIQFGGVHYSNGWQEWARITKIGVSSTKFIATASGSGDNYKVGDDAYIGDCNMGNTIMIKGIQSSAAGFITFGNGGGTIGYNGTKGSSIDLIPAANNGAANQVYVGGNLYVGENIRFGNSRNNGAYALNTEYINANGIAIRGKWDRVGNEPRNLIYTYDAANQHGGIQRYSDQLYCECHYVPASHNSYDLGFTGQRWRGIWTTGGNITGSDIRFKENIKPIDEISKLSEDGDPTLFDYYNFIKNELHLYSFDYKLQEPATKAKDEEIINPDIKDDEVEESTKEVDYQIGSSWDEYTEATKAAIHKSTHNIGFIAQDYDIKNNKIAQQFIFEDSDGMLVYKEQAYVGVLASALKVAVNKIDYLEKENAALKADIEKIKAALNII